MERLKNNLEIFVVVILLVGCNSKTQNVAIDNTSTDIQAQTIDIKFDEAVPISHVFNVTFSININEDTDHIMGSIQQMVVQGDTIYGIDPISHPGLYAYLDNGSQLFAYCNRGQGPEDMMSPMNMSISNNEISVFDFAEKKIMIFSKEGKYLESIELPIDALAAMLDSSGGIWIDFSNQDYDDVKLGYTNGSMDSIQCVLKVPDYLKGMTEVPMTNILSLANGELRYLPSMECGVYKLKKGKANLIYELDFHGIWPSEEEFKDRYAGNDWAVKYKDFPIRNKGFHENDKWVILGFMYEKKLYIIVYDKHNMETHIFVDSENTYLSPKYVEGSNLYITRQDDAIDIVDLEKIL